MTDVIDAQSGTPDAPPPDASTTEPAAATAVLSPATTADVPAQWAPEAPRPRSKKRLWLGIGIPLAVVAVGTVAASLVLIAPGTTVAGVPVGFLTAGGATDAIQSRLAQTEITLGDGGPTLTGADLGATVDAEGLAAAAFEQHPMWNFSTWFGEEASATVTVDADTATAAMQSAAPDLFTAPQPAAVTFDGTSYVVTPAVDGEGIDVGTVRDGLSVAFGDGSGATTIDVVAHDVPSATTTEMAQATADQLNGMLDRIGFYVGDERTVPVSREVAASWLTVGTDADGAFTITADTAGIQSVVAGLKDAVDQEPASSTVVTNAAGTVLRTSTEGADGRVLGATTGIASAFADQLADGNAVYELPVEVTPHKTATLARLLEVDLGEQRLYLKENGAVVDSWPISSGVGISPTYEGRFTINSHIRSQTMRSTDPDNPYWTYEVPNVEWVMYFNGNQAFHGVYWHSNFGTRQSHGCVGMPNWRAQQIYDWAPTGADVWIHG